MDIHDIRNELHMLTKQIQSLNHFKSDIITLKGLKKRLKTMRDENRYDYSCSICGVSHGLAGICNEKDIEHKRKKTREWLDIEKSIAEIEERMEKNSY